MERTQEEANSELRRPLYTDVEALITPGFLASRVTIQGVTLSLRSPTPGDLFMLRNRVDLDSDAIQWKEWAIASTIWMVDGQSLLEDPHSIVTVRATLRRLPRTAINILFSIYLGLFNRMGEAINRVEPYCYENYSRKLWRFCGRRAPNRMSYSGVPGTERLGLNHIQQMWLAYNLGEDERIATLQSWSEAKLIASASAPKGVKKLNQKDSAALHAETARRGAVQDQMYYGGTGRVDMADMVIRAVTAVELEEQMRRVVAGEKDYHDEVVDAWKANVWSRLEAQKRQTQAKREALAQLEQLEGKTTLVGYTPEQLEEVLRSRPNRPVAPGARFLPEANGRARHLAERGYLQSNVVVGQISIGKEGVNIRPMVQGKRKGRSLNDEIANRRVTLTPPKTGGS